MLCYPQHLQQVYRHVIICHAPGEARYPDLREHEIGVTALLQHLGYHMLDHSITEQRQAMTCQTIAECFALAQSAKKAAAIQQLHALPVTFST